MTKHITPLPIPEKYLLENISISDAIKEGAKKGNTIDQLSILLRAMGMLEFNLADAVNAVNRRLDGIDTRLTSIELRLSGLEAKDQSFEERIKLIETRLDDYYLKLKNHKHDTL